MRHVGQGDGWDVSGGGRLVSTGGRGSGMRLEAGPHDGRLEQG